MRDCTLKVAAIHDLSGYGRASLTAVIPIISAMGIQVCPLPTAVLSNHTGGFKNFSYTDLTDSMPEYIKRWKEINIDFDAVYSGYLGSRKQIDIISGFIDDFRKDKTLVMVDPVMGDNGTFYKSFDETYVPLMKKLIKKADIITPNFTEASMLLGLKKTPEEISADEAKDWLYKLGETGPEMTVITSVPGLKDDTKTEVLAYRKSNNSVWKVSCQYIPASYPGTGDAFSSVLLGSLLKGESLPVAADLAVQFISQCIKASFGFDYPKEYGVMLEKELFFFSKYHIISDYEKL
ncbi:MAG: pyridoxamine kinase [Candidatus Cloacimonadota bacterium]|nr:MAG: pyridoxamine kinase [Candidatus Cloacimonadota bacterium]